MPLRILPTAKFMAERGVYGLAWLDVALRPFERYGRLADTIPLGVPICEAVPAFIGLEDELAALRGEPSRSLALPNVRMPTGDATDAERLNLAVYWSVEQDCYLLLVARAVSRSDIEYRLADETRARMIAEAEVAATARELARVNQRLATANRDLAEFASVISHDLRASLRGLRYAASDAGAALDADDGRLAREAIDRTLQQARRMGAMLTGLLEYARAGRKAETAETIDTGMLAADVVGSSGAGASQRITIEGSWPTLTTVAEGLDIVLRNLLDNAIKHHDRIDGHIVVRGEDHGDALVVTVADDGPGIAPEWHGAIFLPFRQIADSDTAQGAGIGLALVKRTVERFGGTISVQSEPARARGAMFRVVWPKSLPP
ncbi:MAG: ATP-binding protein [Hyphomicrobiaceae bacterium]